MSRVLGKPLTRRKFGAGALSASLAGSLIGTAGRSAHATPSSGGHLRIGLSESNTVDTLRPDALQGAAMHLLNLACRNCLIEIAADGSLVPELATEWESDDSKIWHFRLREGVEFHNGKSMTVDDVIYSINLHNKEGSISPAYSILQEVASIKPDGKNAFTVELKNPNLDFPYSLVLDQFAIVPEGSQEAADADTSGMGTGGYIIEYFEPGVRAIIKRNPNYWKEGRAHVESAEILGLLDSTARTVALISGEVDCINNVELKTMDRLESSAGIQLIEATSLKHNYFTMRTDMAPFDNKDVRLALKHAIDRNSILKTVYRGRASLGNDHPIGRANRFYDPTLAQREYNIEKAKEHLRKAGLETLEVELAVSETAFAGAVDTALLFAEHAKPAGITIKVKQMPKDGYWSDIWRKHPFSATYAAGRPVEDIAFSLWYLSGAKWNETFWSNPTFDDLVVTARGEPDVTQRRELYAEAQRLLNEDGGAIIPIFANWTMAASEKVFAENVSGYWDMDSYRAVERWWM